jgi:hypothetical protein
MRTVFKYPLQLISGAQTIKMPYEADVVFVDMQNGILTIWAEVDTEEEVIDRGFEVFGTGHSIPDGRTFVGTAHSPDGYLWHVYEHA